VIGFYRNADVVEVVVLFMRQGKLMGRRAFQLKDQEFPDGEVVRGFLLRYYELGTFIPDEVLLPIEIEDAPALAEWLREARGRVVDVLTPQRGGKVKLLELASKNAESSAASRKGSADALASLAKLEKRLNLRALPRRIECFDIAHLQGAATVASMVVFRDGEPENASYRRFRIKTVTNDDFASMYEVLSRRYTRALEEDDLPDLIMVDGGKGQLNIAQSVLWELGIEAPDLISIAKSRLKPVRGSGEKHRTDERFFIPGRKNPVILPPNSPALFLLQRVRDEAHRFAVTYHKNRRAKAAVHSALDDIPGVGPKRKSALLRHFGSVKAIAEASPETIQEVAVVSRDLAELILQSLEKEQHENV